jgi:hypothetical protein
MPTYTYTLNREKFAGKVLSKLGVLAGNQSPHGNDLALVTDAMDLRLKELHALGVLWWQVSAAATSISLTANVVTATISPTDYLFPVSLSLVVGSSEYPIEIIGHREYMAIEDKADTGEPEKAFISGSTIRLWPVPQQNYTAKLTYEAIAADTQTGTSPDVPVESMRALIDVIAGDLVDDYEIQEPKASRLLARQADGLRIIRALNQQRVDSVTLTPEWY